MIIRPNGRASQSSTMKYANLKILCAGLAMMLMAGCANMVNGHEQTLYVDAGSHALCQIKRDDGLDLSVQSLQSFTVSRSSSALKVACENGENAVEVEQDSDFAQRYLLLDIATDFCLVSCFVDGSRKAWYEYQNPIMVDMSPRS